VQILLFLSQKLLNYIVSSLPEQKKVLQMTQILKIDIIVYFSTLHKYALLIMSKQDSQKEIKKRPTLKIQKIVSENLFNYVLNSISSI
jgi:hypothetical protein